ncbi:LacI family transcriptional regulator [Leucobacter allii]|uniref:LacI family DNA-binding transcriptional regulator n=1 Tax=Leucobacter allii TaxID=2932247 RepID=UPI001FD53BA1|nr:LacI family DNA-binding transcriptional regulator [Leucobacter allii]UOR01325.1 LacI family transcriptional regulator [Leucobacter allii]
MSGSRAPTLREVARHAGVHVATASRALNTAQQHLVSEDTRARVQAASAALGYRANAVAQSLRTGTTGTIGVVVADLANPFNASILRGIEHGIQDRGILPLVVETHDHPERMRSAVARLLGNRVDAIVLCAAHTGDEAYVRELARTVPLVLAVRGFGLRLGAGSGDGPAEVLQDDVLGARAAVDHLVGLGHRRIAQLPGNPTISSFVERASGYRAALADHPGVHDLSSGSHASESSVAEGRRLAAELLSREAARRPTALFAHNDLIAVGALDALRAAGLRCPDDVSVIGYNDAPLSDHLDPPLTTVRLPSFELGGRTARLVLEALDGVRESPRSVMLSPEFIPRRSTSAPRLESGS